MVGKGNGNIVGYEEVGRGHVVDREKDRRSSPLFGYNRVCVRVKWAP